ncbi:MAG: polyribonucleotide nucleotidyltransferase, partial [Abditibacteriales bacterium]|nr:polyribonucleotide nucleotidyltransferase [Abditibacteriales bacterium]
MGIQTHEVSMEWAGRTLTIETGTLAQQANGAVTVRYADTMVLVTAVASPEAREGIDFFPLTVDFEEKMYAAGKIPGARFIRREGRPSEKAILTGRLIDRSIRPLFPKGALNDVQVIVTTLSSDQDTTLDIPSLIGASAALAISDIPFAGPIAAIKVGLIDGQFVINPTISDLGASELEMVVTGLERGVVMIEAGARQVPDEVVADAIEFAYYNFQPVIDLQNQLVERVGKPKRAFQILQPPEELQQWILEGYGEAFKAAIRQVAKADRDNALNTLREQVMTELAERVGEQTNLLRLAFDEVEKKLFREMVLHEGVRPDGRGYKDIRPVTCSVGLLPRTHGSGLFTRGETQVLTVATLGAVSDEKILDALDEEESKRFMHHYNFPPFSTGEAKPLRGAGRREIGHGALAERALESVVPDEKDFPYTIRLVSEVLSSNGSTSMASTCGSTLALMDAGVPILAPVAGISIGLVTECDENGNVIKRALLTDIMGMEDQLGDMDFKVAGTRQGITAIQLDLKIQGAEPAMFREALLQARETRLYLLDKMQETIAAPRDKLSPYAPCILVTTVPVDRIGEVIGPGGKTIRGIIERSGAEKIDIEDDGRVFITSMNAAAAKEALRIINDMVREVEIGEVYTGRVSRIFPFGAMVEIFPGKEGLVPVSQIAWEHVRHPEDVLKVGDEVTVRVTDIDAQGRVNLTRKGLLPRPASLTEGSLTGGRPLAERSGRGGFSGRGGGRGGFGSGRGGDRSSGRGGR